MARSVSVVLALITSLLALFVAIDAFAEAPLSYPRIESSYDVRADGSYVNLYRLELHAANDAAARAQGQQAVSYSPQMEDLDIVEAYTRKADGRVLPVEAGAIHDQLAPGTADRALITDLREKVVVFPDFAGGDSLVYALRRTVRHAALPGRFMTSVYLSPSVPMDEFMLTVRAPRDLALFTESVGMAASVADGETVVRTWRGSVAETDDAPAAVGPYDRLPRVFVSSEPDYAAFARDYAALVAPHARVTPSVQALADRVAGALADRREQARALYEWVNAHVRYVALYLGAGALEPHDADWVLAHGWGDCKDHAVLLGALLAARGIGAELVMLNLGNHYTLSGPPTFAQLNHAITYLPEFNLYVDSTAQMAPFGVLPFSEYGKPAVHALADGPVLRHTPPLPAGAASVELRTVATLSDDGRVTGTTTTTATGPYATELRRDAAWIEATGPGAAAQQLRALGTEGAGSFSFAPPALPQADYTVSGEFVLDARPEWLDGDSFALPAGLRLLAEPGDGLIGPLSQKGLPVAAPTPCWPGRQFEEIDLTLPVGRRPVRLPKPTRVDGDLFSYHAEWTQRGDVLTKRAELVSRIAEPLCTGALRHAAAAALDAIRRAGRLHVALSDE